MMDSRMQRQELSATVWDTGRSLIDAQTALKQDAQLMLTTGATRLAVSRGQQTWYHFGSVATFH